MSSPPVNTSASATDPSEAESTELSSGQEAAVLASTAALYIVATPIGNLDDISARAIKVLQSVDIIAAEDTRHSSALARQFAIETPMIAYHDHNEERGTQGLLSRLAEGQQVALISDAGTPLISDPGYNLVKKAQEQGYRVVPIPGACAVVSALSASGLPTDRFVFEGFLPAKQEARRKRLLMLEEQSRTMVFYEAPHRILVSLKAMADVWGGQRHAVLARELTKHYETIISGPLEDIIQRVASDRNQQRGEMVVMVKGLSESDADVDAVEQNADKVLRILLAELPVKQATALAVKLTGLKKNFLYQRAIALAAVK